LRSDGSDGRGHRLHPRSQVAGHDRGALRHWISSGEPHAERGSTHRPADRPTRPWRPASMPAAWPKRQGRHPRPPAKPASRPWRRRRPARVGVERKQPERRLSTRAPFHLQATVRVLQRRSTNLVERWEDGRYRRVLAVRSRLVLVEVRERGTIDAPDLRYAIVRGSASAATHAAVAQTLRAKLGLDVDP